MTPTRTFVVATCAVVGFTVGVAPSYAEAQGQSRRARAAAPVHAAVPRVPSAPPVRSTIRSPVHLYSARRFGLDLHAGWAPGFGFSRFGPYAYDPFGYRYGYPASAYVVPVSVDGGVRITDAPRDAQVFVDGYYAGVVNNFDGLFQRLNLEPGPHQIEIRTAASELRTFDVNVQPGRTMTVRAELKRSREPNEPQE